MPCFPPAMRADDETVVTAMPCFIVPSRLRTSEQSGHWGSARSARLIEGGLAQIENSDQRRALWLLLDQEFSYQEIAEEMSAELNTVRSWIRRGRLAMRLYIAGQLEFDGLDEAVA